MFRCAKLGLSALLAGMLAVAAAASAGTPEFPAGSSMAQLSKKDQIRIGVKFDQPLFGLRDLSGKPIGFDVEIAKLVASKLGFKPNQIRWVETASANREPFLQQGKVDLVVATYAISDKRKKVVTFAGPYIVGGQDLMILKRNAGTIHGPQDLDGKKACVINGSEGQKILLQKYPKAQVVPFDVVSKCVEALKNGSVDALVTSNLIEGGLISRDPAASLTLAGKPFTYEPWGVGMPKSQAGLCKFVSGVLQQAGSDGTYQKLYDKLLKPYLGGDGVLPKLDSCPNES